MNLPLHQIDAFTGTRFRGNPAAVCPLETWLSDELLQAIAAENNLSETAFCVPRDGAWELRWFTPTTEVDLCGHATLAAAHALFSTGRAGAEEIIFHSRSGPLRVRREGAALTMDFPVQTPEPCATPEALAAGLGRAPASCFRAADYLAVFPSQRDIEEIRPDFGILRNLDRRGVIITAPGAECDFVSRFFAPNCGIDEDPVTGSAHCALTPFWADRLGKTSLTARQVSRRGGDLRCRLAGDRVFLSGEAVLYLEGTITV